MKISKYFFIFVFLICFSVFSWSGTKAEKIEGIRVNLSGYVFEGSINQSLTFRCVLGGYVHLDGTGTVTMKDGGVLKLGRNSPTPASTAASLHNSGGTQAKASIAGKWSGKTAAGISLTVTLSSTGDKTSVMKVGYCFPPMASEVEELSMDDDSAFGTTDGRELSFAMPVLKGFSGIGGWYKVKLSWTNDQAIKATLTKTDQPSTDYAKKITAKRIAIIYQEGQPQDSYTISLKRKDRDSPTMACRGRGGAARLMPIVICN